MSSLKDSQHLKIPLQVIKLATKDFETCIGKGGYGKVYKGELSIFGRPTTVAVKRLNEHLGQGLKEFLTEIQLLCGQRHQNIISLLGYCDEGKEKIIVYEYAARGSLDTYLTTSSCTSSRPNTRLTWQRRLEICLDAARGLNHLHNHARKDQSIIHRDIKSANILIDDNWVAKISDLGLSKLSLTRYDESTIITNACGTLGYCDPEYSKTGILKKESDVYSFGMVLFEVLCGRLCIVKEKDGFLLSASSIKEYYQSRKLEVLIDPSLREEIRPDSMTRFVEIAYRCLLDDRAQRPSMNVVVNELEESLKIQLSSTKADGKKCELILSNNDQSPNSESYALHHARRIRCEKVKRIFQHFDLNKDGGLNEEELGRFLVASNPGVDYSESDLGMAYCLWVIWYNKFTDEEKGLTFEGLLLSYDEGHGDVEKEFTLLGLELRSDDNGATSSTQDISIDDKGLHNTAADFNLMPEYKNKPIVRKRARFLSLALEALDDFISDD